MQPPLEYLQGNITVEATCGGREGYRVLCVVVCRVYCVVYCVFSVHYVVYSVYGVQDDRWAGLRCAASGCTVSRIQGL